jgi:hypothetical protein
MLHASPCNQYNCKRTHDDKTGQLSTSLTSCRLPAMPTFEISAPNVLESDGRLKYYWMGETVCDVLVCFKHQYGH